MPRDPAAREAMRAAQQALQQQFKDLDSNGDDYLGLGEIKDFMRQGDPSMTDRECQMLFEQIDKSGDYRISFKEFVIFVTAEKERLVVESSDAPQQPVEKHHEHADYGKMTKEQLKGAFKKWDKNGDGRLNFQEMARLLRRGNSDLSDKELEFLFSKADLNDDRKIDFSEFIDYIEESTDAAAGKDYTTRGSVAHGTK